jgi:hypothetical protein
MTCYFLLNTCNESYIYWKVIFIAVLYNKCQLHLHSCQYCSFIYSFINNMTCLRYIENVYFIRKQQHIQHVVQFSDSKVFSHYILRFKMFKFVQTTTTSHCYITLRDTSLKFFSFSAISKTSSSFSSPHFGQLVRYSDTYFSLEGKLYFDI